MLTDVKIHTPEKASEQIATEQGAFPSTDFDLMMSSVSSLEESAFEISEDVEQPGTNFIFVNASYPLEEGAPQHVAPPDDDLGQSKLAAVLKRAAQHPLVTIPLDTQSEHRYSWSKSALESPGQHFALSVGGQAAHRRVLGTADLLSALSKAQRAVRKAFQAEPTPADRARFRELADKWVRETEGISIHSRAVMHRAYQQIIGMGPVAIPLLLEALRDQPDHWMWALSVLTDEDPARDTRTFQQARAAWLNWGREQGYLGD